MTTNLVTIVLERQQYKDTYFLFCKLLFFQCFFFNFKTIYHQLMYEYFIFIIYLSIKNKGKGQMWQQYTNTHFWICRLLLLPNFLFSFENNTNSSISIPYSVLLHLVYLLPENISLPHPAVNYAIRPSNYYYCIITYLQLIDLNYKRIRAISNASTRLYNNVLTLLSTTINKLLI